MRQPEQIPPDKITHHPIALHPTRVAFILGGAAFLLVAASTTISFFAMMAGNGRYRKLFLLFNVSNEWNIPAFFSAFLLFSAFWLLLFIAAREKKRMSIRFRYWGLLACGFLFMAVDELCSIHEKLIPPMRAWMGSGPYGFLYFSWVVCAIPVVLILILLFIKFWWRLPAKTKLTFLTAAVVYLGGCIGFELIGGYYLEKHGPLNMTFCLLEAVEESLEMGGVIIFIWGLLTYMEDFCQEEIHAFTGSIKRKTQNLPLIKHHPTKTQKR